MQPPALFLGLRVLLSFHVRVASFFPALKQEGAKKSGRKKKGAKNRPSKRNCRQAARRETNGRLCLLPSLTILPNLSSRMCDCGMLYHLPGQKATLTPCKKPCAPSTCCDCEATGDLFKILSFEVSPADGHAYNGMTYTQTKRSEPVSEKVQ